MRIATCEKYNTKVFKYKKDTEHESVKLQNIYCVTLKMMIEQKNKKS